MKPEDYQKKSPPEWKGFFVCSSFQNNVGVSAVALRKGLWRDKQEFSPACPAVAGRLTLSTSSAETRGERCSSEK